MATVTHTAGNELQRSAKRTQPPRGNRKKSARKDRGKATHVFFGLPLKELESLKPPAGFRLSIVVSPSSTRLYVGNVSTLPAMVLFDQPRAPMFRVVWAWRAVCELLNVEVRWQFKDDDGNHLRGSLRQKFKDRIGIR